MMNLRTLYWRWIGVNAVGELFGLGLTLGVGFWIIASFNDQGGVGGVLLAFAVAVLSGTIEAAIVGLLQWWAMHPWFPSISRLRWWLGTLGGALTAYVLGYLPSTLMDLSQATAPAAEQAPMAEPPQWLVLLLAALLGAVAGAVLSFAQWLAMRGVVNGSKIWIPANMLAWAVGMPLIFLGIDIANRGQPLWQTLAIMAMVLLVTGAVVGAMHGAFLVRLARGVAD
ncbi:MAG: hypothetical protein MUC85_12620 [Anaerolineales bacterium]|nr:hypothetical protein [Anaerolineales bacterium]